ncbi:MAG: right-handed parallel beta-helix repeat-containing protein, partial [Thermoplasmata archaeon]
DNNITDNIYGLELRMSSYNNVKNNNVSSNRESGIGIAIPSHTNVTGNNLYFNQHGMDLYGYSTNTDIRNNNLSGNRLGIYLTSADYYNVITNNISYCDTYGISLYFASNNRISGNTILHNSWNGIIFGGDFNIIENNNISNSSEGIQFGSDNNIIANNTLSNNFKGIFSGVENNVIVNNSLKNNQYGMQFKVQSSNNLIYHNNIINNTNQAIDETNMLNQWDFGYPSGGNYWSDFDEIGDGAYDDYHGPNQDVAGGDGIVDLGPPIGGKNPYVIDGDSQDNYPLMEPYSPDNFIHLSKGWNLISIPFIQEEQNLTRVLEGIDGWYDAVQWYDPMSIGNSWKHHKVGKPYGNDLSQINETMGIWIHITQPGNTIFFYNGTRPIINHTVTLHPGWNMVGYPSLTIHNRTRGLNNLTFGQDVNLIQWFDSSSQTWFDMGEEDYFVPGRGYWVHANVKCTWEVPL